MDVDKILRDNGYSRHENFGEMARWASGQKFKSAADLLQGVNKKYGLPQVRHEMNTNPAPYKKFFGSLNIEQGAIDQLETALSIPVAVQGAAMPDMHVGYSMPIGGVVALDRAVSPSFVGLDIGCRMHCSIWNFDPIDHIADDDRKNGLLDMIKRSTSFGVNSSGKKHEHPVMHDKAWNATKLLRDNKQKAAIQLGSSGGGNHFCDLMLGTWTDTGKNFMALVTHSGSRGMGKIIAEYYVKLADSLTSLEYNVPKGYGWLKFGSLAADEYWEAMQLMGRYAQANHEVIHQNFWKEFGKEPDEVFENHHNFAWEENGLVVHRKGATPAGSGVVGIIPGSCGTYSYIVKGLGNPDSLYSASHGAGRTMSRTKAKTLYNPQEDKDIMTGILTSGVAHDESVMAYKDIERVMDAQKNLVETLAFMSPMIVVMGGLEKTDDGD